MTLMVHGVRVVRPEGIEVTRKAELMLLMMVVGGDDRWVFAVIAVDVEIALKHWLVGHQNRGFFVSLFYEEKNI